MTESDLELKKSKYYFNCILGINVSIERISYNNKTRRNLVFQAGF